MVDPVNQTSTDVELMYAFEQLTSRVIAGEVIDARVLRDEFPHQADQLESMLPAMLSLAMCGMDPKGSGGNAHHTSPGLLGDYRILREVGRGGMGVVYEAEQISLSRRVALKILPFAAVLDPRHLQRFKNEAMAAAHLDHPNIVEVYGIGCERSIHFYAMRFIDGVTLADVVEAKRQSQAGHVEAQNPHLGSNPNDEARTEVFSHSSDASLSTPHASLATDTSPILQAALSTVNSITPKERFRRIAEIGIQAAEALDHAHQMGIVHRDIKPSNLMIDERGKLWVTDFGLARNQGDASMTMTGDLVGTLRYMSPEQALAKRITVDHRTDIYSLGVTLYELLTLRAAFPSNDRQETLRQIAFEEATTPRKLDKSIPEELETIILKAMEKNPDDRYATAREVAGDLRRWLEHMPIVARVPGMFVKAKKWTRRHSAFTTSAMLLLAISTVLLATSVVLINAAYTKESAQRGVARKEADLAKQNLDLAVQAIDKIVALGSRDLALTSASAELRKGMLAESLKMCRVLRNSYPDDALLAVRTTVICYELAGLEDRTQNSPKAKQLALEAAETTRDMLTRVQGDQERILALIHGFRETLDRPDVWLSGYAVPLCVATRDLMNLLQALPPTRLSLCAELHCDALLSSRYDKASARLEATIARVKNTEEWGNADVDLLRNMREAQGALADISWGGTQVQLEKTMSEYVSASRETLAKSNNPVDADVLVFALTRRGDATPDDELARKYYEEGLAIGNHWFALHPKYTLLLPGIALCHRSLAGHDRDLGKLDLAEAEAHAQAAAKIYRERLDRLRSKARFEYHYAANAFELLAEIVELRGRRTDVRRLYQDECDFWRRLADTSSPPDEVARATLIEAEQSWGAFEVVSGESAIARQAFARAEAELRLLVAAAPAVQQDELNEYLAEFLAVTPLQDLAKLDEAENIMAGLPQSGDFKRVFTSLNRDSKEESDRVRSLIQLRRGNPLPAIEAYRRLDKPHMYLAIAEAKAGHKEAARIACQAALADPQFYWASRWELREFECQFREFAALIELSTYELLDVRDSSSVSPNGDAPRLISWLRRKTTPVPP